MVIEMKSDIKLSTNPSYDITRQNRNQHNKPNYVLYNKNTVETIKMDSNPSYGTVQSGNIYDANQSAYDAATQPNPSYSSIPKETTKMSEDEDQDGYVETSSRGIQKEGYLKVIGSTTKAEELVYDDVAGDIDNVKINANPSYDSVPSSVKLEGHPSYNLINHT